MTDSGHPAITPAQPAGPPFPGPHPSLGKSSSIEVVLRVVLSDGAVSSVRSPTSMHATLVSMQSDLPGLYLQPARHPKLQP